MCLACEEMDLYFTYLAQVEAGKNPAAESASNAGPSDNPQAAAAAGQGPAPVQNAFVCEESAAQ
jgi:hypothetical protein